MAMIIQTIDDVVSNRFEISEPALTFGRTSDNQIQIDDLSVSSEHAKIVIEKDDDNNEIFLLKIWIVPMVLSSMRRGSKGSSYTITI